MSEPKTFASLGPTLLARKGGAKPAMRPQLAPLTALGGSQAAQAVVQDLEDLEDLGWNDMGHDDDEAPNPLHEAQVFALTPAPANADAEAESRVVDAVARAEMAAIAGEPTVLKQRREVTASIASTVKNRSAQQLVTAALDKFLADIPEIEALAAQVSRD